MAVTALIVLIVAKCIVNSFAIIGMNMNVLVLIVAKCIVNINTLKKLEYELYVLIVAKCIVNRDSRTWYNENIMY